MNQEQAIHFFNCCMFIALMAISIGGIPLMRITRDNERISDGK